VPRDDFETPSGFADDFDFFIDDARFGYLRSYMDGQVPLLIWEGHSPDAEDVTEVSFPLGAGWTVRDSGARVEHEKGRKTFIRNSIMGHLIRRVVDELKVEQRYPAFFDGSPREAKLWVGFGFHLKREKISYPNLRRDDSPQGVETERLMPVAVLKVPGEVPGEAPGEKAVPASKAPKGVQGSTTAAASATSAAADPGTPARASDNGSLVGDAARKLIRAKLVALAKRMDRQQFQLAALDMPGVSDDPELLNEVINDSEEGLWAKARA
jgi:hypothetical protein